MAELLRFGAIMLRAGSTAFRVRHAMRAIASRMGIESVCLRIDLESVSATGRRGLAVATGLREVGPPGVNTGRLGALQTLAQSAEAGMPLTEFSAALTIIEQSHPSYSVLQTGVAIAFACASFAFLNGGGLAETLAAAIGGGMGQALRTFLLRRHFNQYAVAFIAAVVACGLCAITLGLLPRCGILPQSEATGLISSILFLVPGFPLVAAILDQLQHEARPSMSRLTYSMMLLLAATVGLSVILSISGVPDTPQVLVFPPLLRFLLRAAASFAGACGFAIIFNSSYRMMLWVGLLAIIGNELRLALRDGGMPLAGAAFLGAMTVGLAASLSRRWVSEPRMALTVPGVVMMVPGLLCFRALFLLNRGEILDGLKAAVPAIFVVGALALGLAAARFLTEAGCIKE